MPHRRSPMGFVKSAVGLCSLLSIVWLGCTSSRADSRCTITAPNENYRAKLAKSVNGSELWQSYFKKMDPSASRTLVSIDLLMERKTRRVGGSGDYDPGTVEIDFRVTRSDGRQHIYGVTKTARLAEIMFGYFDEKATREEIQQVAFEKAEGAVFPFVDRWINLAAIRAMGAEGADGSEFVSLLEEHAEDQWAEDLMSEARQALKKIRGGV